MPDDNFEFDFNSSTGFLSDNFIAIKDIENEEFPLTIVWHEFGHLFGRIIAKKIGNEYGKIIELSFLRNKPYIKFDNEKNEFILKAFKEKSFDVYGYENMTLDVESDNYKKLEKNEFDAKRLLCYVIYLIFGGLFNIYCYKNSPEENDFELCFYNDEKGTNLEGIKGCGGDDWNKSRHLLGFGKFDLKRIKLFKQELFILMKDHAFFSYCEKFITKVYEDHQNKILDTKNCNNLYHKAEILFEKYPNKYILLDGINTKLLSIINQ